MPHVNAPISISDRVASLVLAAALVITVTVIAAVGPTTALVAADAPTGTHNAKPANDAVAESRSNYFPSPVTTPDAEVAAPIATF